jgi:membrane protease YdiL (CAAX protease family)
MPATLAPKRDIPVLALALIYPSVLTWIYLVVLGSPDDGSADASGVVQTTYAAGKIIQFALPAIYIGCIDRSRLWPTRPSAAGLASGLGFGAAVATTMLALYFGVLADSSALAETPAKVRRLLRDGGIATPAAYWTLAVFYALAHSLMEEYYWRWFVFDGLRRSMPMWFAIALSSLGFMAHHVILLGVYFPSRFWALAMPLSLGVAVGGAVWAWLYHRTGTLYAVWLSHGLVDGAIFVIGYAMAAPLGDTHF